MVRNKVFEFRSWPGACLERVRNHALYSQRVGLILFNFHSRFGYERCLISYSFFFPPSERVGNSCRSGFFVSASTQSLCALRGVLADLVLRTNESTMSPGMAEDSALGNIEIQCH